MIAELEAVKNWLKPQLARGSYRMYVTTLERWLIFLNGNQPTKEAAEEFLSHIRQGGTSYSRVSCDMSVLKKYFSWKGIHVEFTLPKLIQARAEHAKYSREHRRSGFIYQKISGKGVVVPAPGKRARPEECELCKRVRKLLYHHWDDRDYSRGLWLCLRCHTVAEAADAGVFSDEYLKLRQVIDDEALYSKASKLRNRALQLRSRLNGDHNE